MMLFLIPVYRFDAKTSLSGIRTMTLGMYRKDPNWEAVVGSYRSSLLMIDVARNTGL